MKKILTFIGTLIFFFNSYSQISYPKTKKKIVKDNYFGIEIEDPYRWLEDDKSENVKHWIYKQNKLTFSYLEKIPLRKEKVS